MKIAKLIGFLRAYGFGVLALVIWERILSFLAKKVSAFSSALDKVRERIREKTAAIGKDFP
ncbi:MAG: hypothetical protein IIX01_00865 [Clostridia bacterium]|nr:hypothetical protein [Clostridia bacterium]